jgi:hypothetical protein
MKTTDKALTGWIILEAGTYPSGPARYRLDRFMADQKPAVEDEGHFDTLDAAVRHGNTFGVNNADAVWIWDLKNGVRVAKRVFG